MLQIWIYICYYNMPSISTTMRILGSKCDKIMFWNEVSKQHASIFYWNQVSLIVVDSYLKTITNDAKNYTTAASCWFLVDGRHLSSSHEMVAKQVQISFLFLYHLWEIAPLNPAHPSQGSIQNHCIFYIHVHLNCIATHGVSMPILSSKPTLSSPKAILANLITYPTQCTTSYVNFSSNKL